MKARQHRHLRARFNLKGPHRVRLADHRVSRGVLGRDGREIEPRALCLIEQIKGAAHAAQHAEAQHIDLHEFQRVDIVLVPFDHLPVIHRGRFDRHQLIKPIEREDEAARMLRKMARRADQLLGKFKRQPEPPILKIEIEVPGLLLGDAFACSSPRSCEAKPPVTSSGKPSALPTSRTAPRER